MDIWIFRGFLRIINPHFTFLYRYMDFSGIFLDYISRTSLFYNDIWIFLGFFRISKSRTSVWYIDICRDGLFGVETQTLVGSSHIYLKTRTRLGLEDCVTLTRLFDSSHSSKTIFIFICKKITLYKIKF
jgi:hypothetical protein